MESVYASKWILDTGNEQLSVLLDNANKLITRIRTAPVIRDDCRDSLISCGLHLIQLIAQTQTAANDMLGEIELAMQIYRTEIPEHKPRFFLFDKNGNIRPVSKEEYSASVQEDA